MLSRKVYQETGAMVSFWSMLPWITKGLCRNKCMLFTILIYVPVSSLGWIPYGGTRNYFPEPL